MKDIHDVIKHAKFGDDRLRGSGVVAGQILAFPIDFAGRPYNTLTLPCERVMSAVDVLMHNVRYRLTDDCRRSNNTAQAPVLRFVCNLLCCMHVGLVVSLHTVGVFVQQVHRKTS